ncbi:MAG: hypothetical protein WC375_03605, partial [Methanomassiliicoccales archaeon]|jgi:hypothetical protein
MARDGIYTVLNLTDAKKPMPKAGKEQIEQILQDNGIVQLFNEMSPITVLQLPKIYKPDQSNIVEIDGKQYYLCHVIEPRDPKKSDRARGLEKGVHYDGKLICMDIENGEPHEFSYDEYISQLHQPVSVRQGTLEKVNHEITQWNKRLTEIDKALGVSKLPLQVAWAEDKVNERISVLEAQLAVFTAQQENPTATSEGYTQWINFLREGVRSGQFGIRDTFDTLIFLYKTDPQGLIEGIDNGSIPVPEQLKNVLKGIAAQELSATEIDRQKSSQKNQSRQERMESPLEPEKEPELRPLSPLTLDMIPEPKQPQASTEYHTLDTWAKSLVAKKKSIQRDLDELTGIRNTLADVRGFIGSIAKGQRANEFLASENGFTIIDTLREFLAKAEKFISRYSVNIIDKGTVNPALMSKKGDMGNALLGVTLFRLYNIIRTTLDQTLQGVHQERTPVEQKQTIIDSPSSPVEAINHTFVQKLSNALWMAFEDRMTIR